MLKHVILHSFSWLNSIPQPGVLSYCVCLSTPQLTGIWAIPNLSYHLAPGSECMNRSMLQITLSLPEAHETCLFSGPLSRGPQSMVFGDIILSSPNFL